MPEYIEREKMLDELNKAPAYFDSGDIRYGIEIAIDKVKKQPSADVVEVRHGYWKAEPVFARDFESGNAIYTQYECSECGRVERNMHPYCHCGAKMDGEQKHSTTESPKDYKALYYKKLESEVDTK